MGLSFAVERFGVERYKKNARKVINRSVDRHRQIEPVPVVDLCIFSKLKAKTYIALSLLLKEWCSSIHLFVFAHKSCHLPVL